MDNKCINRRQFIGKTTFSIFSTSFGIPLLIINHESQNKKDEIIYRTLGRTKLQIPIISFGVMNSDSPDLLKKALEMGIKHLDTAHVYLRGNSEKVIGEVLEETGMRKKVYIATKMRFARDREENIFLPKGNAREPGATEDNFNNQLNTSLRRLRSDYVDILYVHSCYSQQMATFEPLMMALVKAKESGKARFIGISTHKNTSEVIRAAVDTGVYDVIEVAYNFMMKDREEVKKAIQYATRKGLGIIAMKTQGGRHLSENRKDEINHKAALKWLLNDENVCTTIPGMTTFDQMKLNFSVMSDLSLTDEEKKDLQLGYLRRGPLYCQNCRNCISSCPYKVEIPNLMRAYMYAEGYGNLIQSVMTIDELPEYRGLDVCLNCCLCVASCRFGINIKGRVRTLIEGGFYWTLR
ncbi:MAG: aldo/keto reductase [Methanomassiliicoccales archaeon]|nr:MAG: aldo/keto reductase [Methanomassiliicoccales archaeon]